MMPELGKYADTVLSAYGVSVAMLIGLVWWSIVAARKARRELDQVEGRRNG